MAKKVLRRVVFLSLSSMLLAFPAPPAEAAEVKGFGINRFEPSGPDSDWFTLESLDFQGKLSPAFKLVGDWNHKPQKAYSIEGGHHAIVDYQFALHPGASLTFANRFRVGASMPFYVLQAGNTVERFDGTYIGPSGAGVGDLRLGVDARVFGEPLDPLRLGVGFRFWLPTGSAENYTGDGKYKLEPRVNLAGEVGVFEYAASVSYLHRGRRQSYVLTPIGDEVRYALGIGLRITDAIFVGPELDGAFAISDTGDIYEETTVFGSFLIGGRYQMNDFRIGIAGGPGLSNAAGTPTFRGLVSASWMPR